MNGPHMPDAQGSALDDPSTSGHCLDRRQFLAGFAAVAGSAAIPAAAGGTPAFAAVPAVVAADAAGELGPNVFGADSLGVAEQLPVDDDGFEQSSSSWERVVEAPALVEIRGGAGRDGGGGAVVSVPEQAPVAWPNVGQRLPAPPVRTLLRMSAWVRTSEVADGYGAYLAIDYLDAAGKRITWSQSGSLKNTHDWVRIEMLGEVPPDTTTIAIRLLLNGHGEAAFDDVSLEACPALDEPSYAPSVRLRETGTVLNADVQGVGVQNNVYAFAPRVLTPQQRSMVEERLSALRPSWVRVFTDTTWWVSGGRYDFGGPMTQGLLQDLRLYDNLGTRANIVMWRPLDWSPDRYADLADHLVALLSWLRSQGVDNIAALTLYNEPDGEFPGSPAQYVEMYRTMAVALADAGLEDITLVAGDSTQGGDSFFDAVVPPLRDVADWSSYHEYVGYRSSLTIPTLHVLDRVRASYEAGVPNVFLWESNLTGGTGAGTFTPGTHDGVLLPARYPVALKLAAYQLQALAGGVKGVSYWEAFDMRYGGPGDSLMSFGTWGPAEDGMPLRPTFYSVQLLSRFIRPGARVTRLVGAPDRAVLAYGVQNRDGGRLFYVLNPWDRGVDIDVELLGQAPRALRYQLDESSVSDAIAQQRTVLRPRPARIPDQRTLTDVVPPESMVLYELPPALADSRTR